MPLCLNHSKCLWDIIEGPTLWPERCLWEQTRGLFQRQASSFGKKSPVPQWQEGETCDGSLAVTLARAQEEVVIISTLQTFPIVMNKRCTLHSQNGRESERQRERETSTCVLFEIQIILLFYWLCHLNVCFDVYIGEHEWNIWITISLM